MTTSNWPRTVCLRRWSRAGLHVSNFSGVTKTAVSSGTLSSSSIARAIPRKLAAGGTSQHLENSRNASSFE